ncbi:MAG: hypothetical protein U0793_29770 [Gemmataceae bacterium]
MGLRETMRSWTLQGMSPTGHGRQEFRIPNSLVGPEDKFHELKLVKEILELPTVVFEGLREEQEAGLCYAGIPSGSYTNQGRKKRPLDGKTFLVFLTEEGKVFQWRWEEADAEREGYPEKWQERFGSQKWPKT